jgi:hypothetical protein
MEPLTLQLDELQIVDRLMLRCLGDFFFNGVVSPLKLGKMGLDVIRSPMD